MYNKVECITVTCDNCQDVFQDAQSGFSLFVDEGSAHEYADGDGWHEEEGRDEPDKHYCPDCHTINDDDELVIDVTKFKAIE